MTTTVHATKFDIQDLKKQVTDKNGTLFYKDVSPFNWHWHHQYVMTLPDTHPVELWVFTVKHEKTEPKDDDLFTKIQCIEPESYQGPEFPSTLGTLEDAVNVIAVEFARTTAAFTKDAVMECAKNAKWSFVGDFVYDNDDGTTYQVCKLMSPPVEPGQQAEACDDADDSDYDDDSDDDAPIPFHMMLYGEDSNLTKMMIMANGTPPSTMFSMDTVRFFFK